MKLTRGHRSTCARGGGSSARTLTLVAVCAATFMLLVDLMVVQVALPTIQRQVGGSFTDLQWVIDAYALTLTAMILGFGCAADRYGRKRVFIAGVAVFTLASLLCGFANGVAFLIAARALQGFGGAAMFATGLALIGQEFQGEARGRAIAAWGATVGMASAAGPLLGGGVTDLLGWRWVFLLNVPVGIATIILASRLVNIGDAGATRLDWPGLVTFSGALAMLLIGVLRGNAEGWGSPLVVSLLAGSLIAMIGFVLVERRQARPMFDLQLFRNPAFLGVSAATLALGAGMFAALPFVALYLQNELGYSPLMGGICLLPGTALCFIVPLATRSRTAKLPPGSVLAAGLASTGAGLWAMHRLTATSTWTALVPGLLLVGLGVGIANPAIGRIALGVVSPQRTGMASGISNTFRVGGIALGVAALGAVFEHHLDTSLRDQLGQRSPQLADVVASGGSRAVSHRISTHDGVVAASHHASVAGLDLLLMTGSVLVFLGAAAAIALIRHRHLHEVTALVARLPERAAAEPAAA